MDSVTRVLNACKGRVRPVEVAIGVALEGEARGGWRGAVADQTRRNARVTTGVTVDA